MTAPAQLQSCLYAGRVRHRRFTPVEHRFEYPLVMLYLDLAYRRRLREGAFNTRADLTSAITDGASRRIRPMLMTGLALIMGLVPIMYNTGAGANVMRHIAAPMLGGVGSALILVLIVFPAIFSFWRGRGLPALVPRPAKRDAVERTGDRE